MNYKYVKFDEEDLEYFLEVYDERKILIASFIQKLYRLVNLNFLISCSFAKMKKPEINDRTKNIFVGNLVISNIDLKNSILISIVISGVFS